jgi:hypothetical protein
MIFGGLALLLEVGLMLLAVAFGAIAALIVVELRKKHRRKSVSKPERQSTQIQSEEERKRRQDLVVQLMDLYSGVHSSDALSSFLNKELERRLETWRVRVPVDGPGEIYDPGPN